MSIRKLLLQGGAQFNIDGNASRSVVYRSDSQQEAAVLADPDLPALGAAHPDNPFLFVKTRAPQRAEDGTIDVVVTYSTQPYENSPPPTKQPGDQFARYIPGTRAYTLKVPASVLTPKRIAQPDNSSVVVNQWAPRDFELPRTWFTFTISVTIPKLQTFTDGAAFAAKNNKIHLIHGIDYLFNVEFGTPLNDKFDTLRYQWAYDPGTPGYGVLPAGIDVPQIDRLPFHRWVRIPAADAAMRPTYSELLEFERDDNGWVGLPGVPPL